MEIKLYVGNLSFETKEDQLNDLFAQAGKVTSVELIKDRITGGSKGFAFVQMSSQSEASKAISMFNGYNLDNREIKVSPARPREEGGFGGRNNGSYGRAQGAPHGHKRGGTRRY
jgi:cold-inducible RNA-binding protein